LPVQFVEECGARGDVVYWRGGAEMGSGVVGRGGVRGSLF